MHRRYTKQVLTINNLYTSVTKTDLFPVVRPALDYTAR